METSRKIEFYPEHPSDEKTYLIETTIMPLLEQDKPFNVKEFCEEFAADADSFFAKYVDKRFEVTGVAKKIGPDAHNKPSIELADSVDGRTYALVIFQNDDHYSKVNIGDTVVVRANYLVMSDRLGVVMKYSELVSVEKQERIMNTMVNEAFWSALDSLVAQSEIVIDRPKGSAHPRYPDFIYEVDYGYLKNTSSMDGDGIDVWVGTAGTKIDAIICIVDLMKRDSEIKILIGCTEEEKAIVYRTHNETEFMKGILIRR